MALTTCRVCSGEISDLATTCPHCGEPMHRRTDDRFEKWGTLVIGLVGALIGAAAAVLTTVITVSSQARAAQMENDAQFQRLLLENEAQFQRLQLQLEVQYQQPAMSQLAKLLNDMNYLTCYLSDTSTQSSLTDFTNIDSEIMSRFEGAALSIEAERHETLRWEFNEFGKVAWAWEQDKWFNPTYFEQGLHGVCWEDLRQKKDGLLQHLKQELIGDVRRAGAASRRP